MRPLFSWHYSAQLVISNCRPFSFFFRLYIAEAAVGGGPKRRAGRGAGFSDAGLKGGAGEGGEVSVLVGGMPIRPGLPFRRVRAARSSNVKRSRAIVFERMKLCLPPVRGLESNAGRVCAQGKIVFDQLEAPGSVT